MRTITVPMEEVVRAFNFVIEKGWVGHRDVSIDDERLTRDRRSTGRPPSGPRKRLKLLTVCPSPCLAVWLTHAVRRCRFQARTHCTDRGAVRAPVSSTLLFCVMSCHDNCCSMLNRERPEREYAYVSKHLYCPHCPYSFNPSSPLYRNYNLGTTVFSALAGGILTGKVLPCWHHATHSG